jgi:hypothetical protein
MYTFSPVCSPTPVALMTFFSVRCRITLPLDRFGAPLPRAPSPIPSSIKVKYSFKFKYLWIISRALDGTKKKRLAAGFPRSAVTRSTRYERR